MYRLNVLIVAALLVAASGMYLRGSEKLAIAAIRASADRQLNAAHAALEPTLKAMADEQAASAKVLAADAEIAQAFDDAHKPTPKSLEVAISALAKLDRPELAKPDLLLLLGGGAAARFRPGATNRFYKDDAGFKAIGAGKAHTLLALVDGEPFELAAAPLALPEDAKPETGGQVVLGRALGDTFVQAFSKAAGVEVSILAEQKFVSSTLTLTDRRSLPTSAKPGDSMDFGELSGEAYSLFGLASLPLGPPLGAAGATASRALAFQLGGGATAILSTSVGSGFAAVAADQKWVLLSALALVLLCLLLAGVTPNPAKGIGEVAAAADKIAQGDLALRAPTEGLASQVRRIAVALNAIAANSSRRTRPASTTKAPAAEPTAEAKPTEAAKGVAAAEAPTASAEAAAKASPPAPPSDSKPESSLADLFDAQPPAPAPAVPKTGPKSVPPAPPPAAPSSPAKASKSSEDLARAMWDSAFSAAQTEPAPAAAAPSPAATPADAPPASPGPAADGDAQSYDSIYREFTATRERCGEPPDGVTYDQFVAKLLKNQEQLVSKYACKSVKFSVYVKEGKAALKATPVRD
jgi:hypothetical protein